MGRLFGTDGIRGLANADLDPELAMAVSLAAVHVLGERIGGRRPVAVVGRDPRVSGEMLEAAVLAGLTSAGADALRAGVLPTPAIAQLTADTGADLGVMLSASHNPMPDNGIKIFARGGHKLPDAIEDEIEARLGERWTRPTGAGIGRVQDLHDAGERYVDHLLATLTHKLDGLRVVVDCAHGAAARVAPLTYSRAGAEVISIAADPDGLNINDGVGSTHLAGLLRAVVDSGADLRAPDLADKAPATWSVLGRSQKVRDRLGHGTFVSSLAAGSVENGIGISGFGGDAKLLVVQAIDADGYITDVDEAAAIVYAVKHGARIFILSTGATETSAIEQRAIRWATRQGALIVAAAGNEHDEGNPVEYPAALLQPVGSRGRGGIGLSVGATSMDGSRAYFSNTGSYVSLAAPGYNVFAAESADSDWPRAKFPWQSPGYYGWASGTSFAAPEVAGVAALVWGANPRLTARQVAQVLKQSAGGDTWNPELGWGRLDAAAAVELALATKGSALRTASNPAHEPRPTHSSPPS